VKKAMELINER